MCRAFCLLAPLIVAANLYALWSDWFTRLEMSCVGKRPVFSDVLDLSRAGPAVWLVPNEKWSFAQGEAHLALSLNLNTLLEIPADREQLELRVKVRAEGRVPGGEWQDRLLRDWYFTTDEPFSAAGSTLWESYGRGRLEYGLAGVQVVPGEEMRITVHVQVPDGRLMTGHPRLKLVGKYDFAAIGPRRALLFALREGGPWLSIGLVIILAVLAWRGPSRIGPPEPLKAESCNGTT